jgi:hypothetical protein
VICCPVADIVITRTMFQTGTAVAQSVCAIGYGVDDRGSFPGEGSDGFFLSATASRPTLGPTQLPIQWVPGAVSSEVKRPRREADHSPHHLEPKIRMHGTIPPLP